MLEEKEQSIKGSIFDKHWIVQRSRINYSNDKVRLKVFSWGDGQYSIPNGNADLKLSKFTQNFYGYVAGKP